MELTSALLAYDEVISQAAKEGRPITTADKLRAMKAAIEAYEVDKANVLPPTRGTDSQHIGAFTGDLPERIIARITCAIEHEIDSQLTASGMSAQDMQRQDGDAILTIVLDELAASGCVEVARRFRAPGGITSNEKESADAR